MPKEILSYTPHELSYASYEEKPLASDEIRVRVDYAAPKHGSELHGWRSDPDAPARDFDAGTKCFMEKPRNGGEEAVPGAFRPGNMWVGRVTETGSAVASFRQARDEALEARAGGSAAFRRPPERGRGEGGAPAEVLGT